MSQDVESQLEAAFEHAEAGRLVDAERVTRDLLVAHGDRADAWRLLGMIALMRGDANAAKGAMRRAVDLMPNVAEFHFGLGNALRATKDAEGAIASYRRAVALDPRFGDGWMNLGTLLLELGRSDEAETAFVSAMRANPNDTEAMLHLAKLARGRNDLDRAIDLVERVVQLSPQNGAAWSNLASDYLRSGRLSEAIAADRRALAAAPGPYIHSNLLFHLNNDPAIAEDALFAEHVRWGERWADPVTAQSPPFPPGDRADADRKPLRIGFLASDFHPAHPVSVFIAPMLTHLNRAEFAIAGYCHGPPADELRPLVPSWRDIAQRSDDEVARQIRADGIDILVDLSGHTKDHRLGVFARRAAPVQVTHFAYPNTTGMQAMDWRITDAVADPIGSERFYRERLLRLPQIAWCYSPPNECDAPTPSPRPLPSQTPEPRNEVTFGCVNSFPKVTAEALDTWVRILAATPASKLILLGARPEDPRLLAALARHQVARERVLTPPRGSRADYFKLIQSLDIALDPFPYNGGITTCDTLWMGVPVIALEGNAYRSRQSAAILPLVGLADLVCPSATQLITQACALAGDASRRHHLRQTLRTALLRSPLCDSATFVRNLQLAYRQMWHARCLSF